MPDPKRQLPRRVYPLRVMGMALSGVVVGLVLWERNASLAAWLCMALIVLTWPHVAYQLSRHSADPYRTEIRNLLVDSALVAAFVPLMHFNLLPSVLLVTLTTVDKITTGIRGLCVRSLPGMAGAAAASAALIGFHWAPETSMPVIIACLPVIVLHTLSVSVVSCQLIRTVSKQNQLLDELRRVDALTGLYGRGHWQEQAEATLRRHHATDEPACLVMLDIDHFKQINDRYGHTVGDEVLRALARIVLNNVRATDCAGRYGGDEFAIVLRGMQLDHAMQVAQRIREQVQALQLRELPTLRLTSSLGVAPADHRLNSLRAWTNAADAELYQAKAAGRNRVSVGALPALVPVV
jgi:diguanylate cyclase